jgi:hypothetical protein
VLAIISDRVNFEGVKLLEHAGLVIVNLINRNEFVKWGFVPLLLSGVKKIAKFVIEYKFVNN